MILICDNERSVEQVDDDKKDDKYHYVEGNEVALPLHTCPLQPVSETENLRGDRQVLDVGIFPLTNDLARAKHQKYYQGMEWELKELDELNEDK